MKKQFALLFFILLFVSSFTMVIGWIDVQPQAAATELIELNKKLLKNERYSFNVKYTSYKTHEETIPHETQKGFVIKDGICLYSKLGGSTTIQNKDLRIVIDSVKQFIKITNALEGQDPNFNMNDYIKALGVCKTVKRKQEDNIIAFRFEPKAGQGIVAQEIYLGEEFLKKSVIFYVNEHNIRENNEIVKQTVRPRLEILISDFKKLEKVNKEIFRTDGIIHITKNEIELKGKYKTFKFFDGRYKK